MEPNHAIDIDRTVRGFVVVFITLLALTAVTVAVSYLHLEEHEALIIALAIASFKASLVALYFMRLLSEEKVIFLVLAFTVLFFFVLLFVPLLTNLNHVRL
ncbi:MAG TPA: cytochrome C oxidase subunit IV family protein [Candidatus Dormibacteraeota bacterium]|nr:cytochrome C oxidase subunit IV family protein [Candidatus Dormibacteraeota bacterium]